MRFNIPLIDGSPVLRRESRADVVKRMAADLVKFDAFRDEGDAIRSLMHRQYSPFDVLRYVDDARQVAVQDVVAREISQP